MPLGRQVNYKLAPNTWRRRSPPSEGNVTAAVCLCLFMCVGSEESRVALLSKLSESLSKELVRHDVHTSYTYTLARTHTHTYTVHTAADASTQTRGGSWWNPIKMHTDKPTLSFGRQRHRVVCREMCKLWFVS